MTMINPKATLVGNFARLFAALMLVTLDSTKAVLVPCHTSDGKHVAQLAIIGFGPVANIPVRDTECPSMWSWA